MKYPSNEDFKVFFKRLPKWVIGLILLLLFGRFIILVVWKILMLGLIAASGVHHLHMP